MAEWVRKWGLRIIKWAGGNWLWNWLTQGGQWFNILKAIAGALATAAVTVLGVLNNLPAWALVLVGLAAFLLIVEAANAIRRLMTKDEQRTLKWYQLDALKQRRKLAEAGAYPELEADSDPVTRTEFVHDERDSGRIAGIEAVHVSGRRDATVTPETVAVGSAVNAPATNNAVEDPTVILRHRASGTEHEASLTAIRNGEYPPSEFDLVTDRIPAQEGWTKANLIPIARAAIQSAVEAVSGLPNWALEIAENPGITGGTWTVPGIGFVARSTDGEGRKVYRCTVSRAGQEWISDPSLAALFDEAKYLESLTDVTEHGFIFHHSYPTWTPKVPPVLESGVYRVSVQASEGFGRIEVVGAYFTMKDGHLA